MVRLMEGDDRRELEEGDFESELVDEELGLVEERRGGVMDVMRGLEFPTESAR